MRLYQKLLRVLPANLLDSFGDELELIILFVIQLWKRFVGVGVWVRVLEEEGGGGLLSSCCQ